MTSKVGELAPFKEVQMTNEERQFELLKRDDWKGNGVLTRSRHFSHGTGYALLHLYRNREKSLHIHFTILLQLHFFYSNVDETTSTALLSFLFTT
jgi:hypothetical protein